jgi:microcystin degradation protein MlrC
MIRIVTGTISHETHVLSNISTGLDEFRSRRLLYGNELFREFTGTATAAGGIIEGCKRQGFELIPTVYASATPSGIVTKEAFDIILRGILDGIKDSESYHAIILHLHGAGVSEEFTDIEGKVLMEARKLARDRPVVSTFDLHANYTSLMVENADLLIGYDTYPHVDGYERGLEAVELTARMLDGSLKPTVGFRQPPMMPALQVQFTGKYPMKKLIEEAHRIEKMEKVEQVTVAAGFPWNDIPEAGMSFIVTTNDDQELADKLAYELSEIAWNMRRDFLVRPTPLREALRQVKITDKGLTVLADIGDNPGGGAPEDGTIVLRTVLEEELTDGVFAVIWDPKSVVLAVEAGVGEKVSLVLGGKTDEMHGEPLEVTGIVKRISDGKFTNIGPMSTGAESDMGKTAVLDIGGNDVILTSKRLQPTDLGLYKSQGINIEDKRFVVVKSSVHYRAAHEPVAKEIIELDTPGLTSPRLASFEFKNIRRPIFPLDAEMIGITELKTMKDM